MAVFPLCLQLYLMTSHVLSKLRAHFFGHPMVAQLISSAFMHLGMSIYVSMAFMSILIPSVSSFLFSLWLCLDNQSAVNSSDPGL